MVFRILACYLPIYQYVEKTNILLAGRDSEFQDLIFSYFKVEYNLLLLLPPSFDDLFKNPFSNPSLAIIDSGFSGNRGLEALKDLKDSKSSLPVIFTSYQTELCFNAFKLGARDCFIKPFFVADIIDSIELILRGKKEKIEDRTDILISKYANSLVAETPIQNNHPSIEKAKRFIEENFRKTLSLDLLAETASKSKYHFCRLFKKQTGMTCTEYINVIRVREAKGLLKNNLMSISEICFLVGIMILIILAGFSKA